VGSIGVDSLLEEELFCCSRGRTSSTVVELLLIIGEEKLVAGSVREAGGVSCREDIRKNMHNA